MISAAVVWSMMQPFSLLSNSHEPAVKGLPKLPACWDERTPTACSLVLLLARHNTAGSSPFAHSGSTTQLIAGYQMPGSWLASTAAAV